MRVPFQFSGVCQRGLPGGHAAVSVSAAPWTTRGITRQSARGWHTRVNQGRHAALHGQSQTRATAAPSWVGTCLRRSRPASRRHPRRWHPPVHAKLPTRRLLPTRTDKAIASPVVQSNQDSQNTILPTPVPNRLGVFLHGVPTGERPAFVHMSSVRPPHASVACRGPLARPFRVLFEFGAARLPGISYPKLGRRTYKAKRCRPAAA